MSWWEGEDIDPDSGLSHITKAIASLTVLRDAQLNDKVIDDRPPVSKAWVNQFNEKAEKIIERIPNPKEVYVQVKNNERNKDII